MSRKSRPNKSPKKNAQIVAESPPVREGFAVLQVTRELNSMVNELGQRRAFDNDVGEYLREKSLIEDFNAWRTARHPAPGQ